MGLKKEKKSSVFNSGRIGTIFGTLVGVVFGGWALLGAFVPGVPQMGQVFMDFMSGDVEGQFSSTAQEPIGVWNFAPDSCRSGEHSGFFGVWLLDSNMPEREIRVAKAADGTLIVSTTANNQRATFVDCQVSGDIHQTNTQVNEVWGLEGQVAIDCPEDGFSGSASFDGCY